MRVWQLDKTADGELGCALDSSGREIRSERASVQRNARPAEAVPALESLLSRTAAEMRAEVDDARYQALTRALKID